MDLLQHSMDLSWPEVVQCHILCPFTPYELARHTTCQIWYHWSSDSVEPISLTALDGFIPFEVPWDCLNLYLPNGMIICPTGQYGLTHGHNACQSYYQCGRDFTECIFFETAGRTTIVSLLEASGANTPSRAFLFHVILCTMGFI